MDALNTILDPSLPLTVTEWEEWGNPLESAEVYAYMKSYSPYENVWPPSRTRPILALGSLNDTRVLYHEPAKWVARLRAISRRPTSLLKTEMGAGHGGPSGRYDAWQRRGLRPGLDPRPGRPVLAWPGQPWSQSAATEIRSDRPVTRACSSCGESRPPYLTNEGAGILDTITAQPANAGSVEFATPSRM